METTVGTFTVLGPAPSKHGHAYARIACGCGAPERTVRAAWLNNGKVRCACQRAAGAPAPAAKPAKGGITHEQMLAIEQRLSDQFAAQSAEFEHRLGDLSDQLTALRQQLAEERVAQAQVVQAQPVAKPKFPTTGIVDWPVGLPQAPEDKQEPKPYPDTAGLDRFDAAKVVKAFYLGKDKSQQQQRFDENLERVKALTVAPFAERTEDLKKELLARLLVVQDRLDYVIPSVDRELYETLTTANRAASRTLEGWHRDPRLE